MAEHYDVEVTAFNVSAQQIQYARQACRSAGLAGKVTFVQEDYRNISGEFDAFVSVGMLEHVGKSHYGTLGRVIDRCLAPHGRGLLHSIGRSQPLPMNAWMERRIFPGAYIPSLREMLEVCETVNLQVNDVENLRLHYARTLEHWLDRYETAADQIVDMYDEDFYRTYQLYLASSQAAFQAGTTQLYQIAFTRPGYNDIPWSREHWYGDRGE
jgi:cyclopropane-fatty-acyl-phospholipid synthase